VSVGHYPADEVDFRLGGAAVADGIPAPERIARRSARLRAIRGVSPGELDLLLYTDVWHQGPEGWQPQYYLQQHLTGGDTLAVEVRHGCAECSAPS
jgi:hypothetical protein